VTLTDEKLWENPSQFDPERFSEAKKRDPVDFVPFGFAGGRVCPGMSYTYAFVPIVVSKIIQNFRITLKNTEKPVPVYGLVTSPRDPIYIQLHHW